MKTIFTLIIILCFNILLQAQISKTVDVTSGSLTSMLTEEEKNTVTNLTLTGTIDASDFRTMRDSMPMLEVVDISEVNITTYEGMNGTNNFGNEYDYLLSFPADEIPIMAFSGKESLQSILFPMSCTSIESAAFSLCTGLTGELNLPSAISKIGVNAFINCTSLTGEVVIPPMVTLLESGIFAQCSGITSLVIPPSVKQIELGSFGGCSGLQLIEVQAFWPIPLTMNQNVFEGVDYNTCILKVPYGTKERYASATVWEEFTNIVEQESGFLLSANSLHFSKEEGTNSSIQLTANVEWNASSDQEWLSVSPATGKNDQILTVSVEANPTVSAREGTLLFTSDGLDSQTITVTQDAVTTAINITSGGLSDALSEQEKQTVSSLTLTGSMDARDFKTIHDQMPLLEVLDIKEVTIEAYTDTTLGNNILYPEDVIPFSPQELDESQPTSYSLSEHDQLTVIILPNTLKTIGYRAFFGCSGLTTVEMQSSVTYIGTEAFMGCSALTDINLPSSLTTISEAAFRWCSSLISIELPSSLEKINYYTFGECSALKSIVIPSSVTSIDDNAFTGCSSLETVTLPSSIILISRESFLDCSSLLSVAIPTGVTLIEEFAFRGCSDLVTLSLPESLTEIGPAAFSDCTSLDTIYSYAVNPPDLNISTGWDVFDHVDKANCLVYVPVGSKVLYAEAYGWKDFTHIVETGQFSLEETEVTLDAGENSKATVKLHSTLPWTAGSDEEWLTVDPASGSGGKLLTLTAEANPEAASRMAIVTIHAEGIDDPLIITVTQQGITVGVEELESGAQVKYYPNPFTHRLVLEIANEANKAINIDIYNLSGPWVKSLAKNQKEAKISITWDGTNEQGEQVNEGVYILRVNEAAWQVVKGK